MSLDDAPEAPKLDTMHMPQPDSKCRAAQMPDSGYASTTTTPDRTSESGPREFELPTGKFFKPAIAISFGLWSRCKNYFDPSERTLCGTLVKVQDRVATIGGVIKVKAQEQESLYCLTVGHVLSTSSKEVNKYSSTIGSTPSEIESHIRSDSMDCTGRLGGLSKAMQEEEQDFSEFDCGDSCISDEFELDPTSDDFQRKRTPQGISKIEHLPPSPITFVEGTRDKNQSCSDWALAVLNGADLYRPNRRPNNGLPFGRLGRSDLTETGRRSTRLSVSRRVVVYGGVSGSTLGILSEAPSSYMRAPATGFAQMYNLSFAVGFCKTASDSAGEEDANVSAALEAGDCGSWVIDQATNEVYGHVIASDVFGEVYVSPLKETLKQVEEVLRADSVSLPIRHELSSWIDLQNGPRDFDELASAPESEDIWKVAFENSALDSGYTSRLISLGNSCEDEDGL
ncbi:hypothetical protein ACLMJK_006282 [Lecanora helva]